MKSIRFFNALLFAKISLTGHVFHRLFPNVLKFFRKTYLLGEKFRKDAIWLLIKNLKINNMVVTFCLPRQRNRTSRPSCRIVIVRNGHFC